MVQCSSASIHYLPQALLGHRELELIPFDTGWEAGYTLDKSVFFTNWAAIKFCTENTMYLETHSSLWKSHWKHFEGPPWIRTMDEYPFVIQRMEILLQEEQLLLDQLPNTRGLWCANRGWGSACPCFSSWITLSSNCRSFRWCLAV